MILLQNPGNFGGFDRDIPDSSTGSSPQNITSLLDKIVPSSLDPPELPQGAGGLSHHLVHLDAPLDENRLQLVWRGEANHPNHHLRSKLLVTHLGVE